MRLALSEDQELLAKAVRELLSAECTPEHVRAARSDSAGVSAGRWARLAELGVPGLTVPEQYGGLGGGPAELVAVLVETGRAALPEPVLETAVGAGLLLEVGGERLRDRWLPRVAAGTGMLAVGLGPMPFVTAAREADLLLLQHGDELHAVPPASVSLTPQPSVDGARRLYRLIWTPAAGTRIATGEPARAAVAAALNLGALGAAAQLAGVADRMIAMAVAHAKARHQFGRPIGAFQAVQHQLADAFAALELTRPVLYRAACSLTAQTGTAARDVSMAKCYASAAATAAARVALQVHGAIGYTAECDLHLWLKRALALGGAWGDADWHRSRVADAVLGPSGASAASHTQALPAHR